MTRFASLSIALFAALSLAASAQVPCEPLSFFNSSGTEYVHIMNMPTPWWGVKMTPPYQFPQDEITVDTAYIAFGITKNNTAFLYDSLEVRVLADTLPLIMVLDYYKSGIMPDFGGLIPDDYWVVEFAFPNPNPTVAVVQPYKSFWLTWRLLGPAADEARIRMFDPAAAPERSIVLNPNGTYQTVSTYLHSGSFRDSVDLWAETRICWVNRVPVELMAFNASYRNSQGVLEWSTATESSNFGFEIERLDARSADGRMKIWKRIGFVNGRGTTSNASSYTFVDEHPEKVMDEQGVVRYRLRQIDYDGHDSRSAVAELQIPIAVSSVELYQNYPNPVQQTHASRIAFSLPQAAPARIEVFDLLGRSVVVLADRAFDAGRHSIDIPAGSLTPGSYIYTLSSGETRLLRRLSVLH